MLSSKTYTGIVVDDDVLRIATVEVTGKSLKLISLDQAKLVSKLDKKSKLPGEQAGGTEDIFQDLDDDLTDESIFGLEDDASTAEDADDAGLEDLDAGLDDLDFDSLDDDDDDFVDVDMVDESEAPSSNELLLYNILNGIDTSRVDLGLTLPSGETIFQILKDVDFSDTKAKDLKVIVEDRLEDLHGIVKDEDYYDYTIREDGSMLLTSVDEEAGLLKLVNKTNDLYSGKIFVHNVIPDELALTGLIRSNYELDANTITGVVQFGEKKSRVIFLKGDQLWIVPPIITEGIRDQRFLNTIFSKILFQLDTGEVPNLDRLILCNNSLGEDAVSFFEDRFPDLDVSEFVFKDDLLEAENFDKATLAPFTTAIGAAWAASGFQEDKFSDISFLPSYVLDRQKIFKLQWHGFVLLFLIFLSPIVVNYFYQANAREIARTESEISQLNTQIQSLEPVVQEYNRINAEVERMQAQLVLLDTLTQGTVRWTKNLDILNSGVDDVNSVWITSMRSGDENTIEIEGVALQRNRIPLIADLFDKAILTDVSTTLIRERDVFTFKYVIQRFVEDESVYSPESTQGIKELLGE